MQQTKFFDAREGIDFTRDLNIHAENIVNNRPPKSVRLFP